MDGGKPLSLLREGLAALAFAGLLVLFFWRLFFQPGTWVPSGGGDLASFLYPVYSFAAESIQRGYFPLWNPYLYGGSPFAADMQSGVHYPVNLIAFLVIRPFSYQAMEGLAVAHYGLAALFAYAYSRTLGVGRLGALAAGTVFAFGGFAVAHLGHLNMLEAAVWLPLILLFLHRALEGRGWPNAVYAGAAYAISILAGHLQVTLYIALFLFAYWLWGVAAGIIEGQSGRQVASRAATLPLAGLTAIAASAVLLLPAYQLTQLSVRAELSYPQAAEFASAPVAFILLFLPHYFGASPDSYWGLRWSLVEIYPYVGILPLWLGLMALLRARRGRGPGLSEGLPLFYLLAGGFFLLLSLGEYTAIHGWVYQFVPGFAKVRAPGRAVLLLDFAVAILCGWGVHELGRGVAWRERPRYRLFLMALGASFSAGALVLVPLFYYAMSSSQTSAKVIFDRAREAVNGLNLALLLFGASLVILLLHRYLPVRQPRGDRASLGRHVLPGVALALIVVDLFSANWAFNLSGSDVAEGFQHPKVVAFLKKDPGPFRMDSVTGVWDVWQPNLGLLYGIEDVMGIYNPFLLADYKTYWENLGSRSVPAYDLLGAKYVVAHKDVQLDWQKFTPVLTDAHKVNVYLNQRALPRSLLVPSARVLPRERILERLRSPDFDPTQEVLLEEGRDAGVRGASSGRVVSFARPSPNEVLVEVAAEREAYLLLSEVMYPGWRAYLDGREVPLLRADYVFRAVALPAGSHRLRFSFEPRLWQAGLAASALAWAGVGVLATWQLASRRKRHSSGAATAPDPGPEP